MGNKSHIKIRRIAYTKLRRLETYDFYNDIANTLKRFDSNAMHIANTCELLIDMQPKTLLLETSEKEKGPHPHTILLDELHEKRLKFAAIITHQMRTVEKANFEDTQPLIALSKPTVYRLLNYLRKNDKDGVEGLINQFFYDLKKKPEIKNALYELGFKRYMDELESVNNEHIALNFERKAQLSKRPKGSTLPVQRELQRMLNILFEQVEHYQHVYADVDYSKLITALNSIIAIYTKLIKTRDTKRKNKKLKLKEIKNAKIAQIIESVHADKEEPKTERKLNNTYEK